MVIPAENKNLPTNDQRGEKFIKLCYNLVPHAFLGDAKSYVGKDRYRIKVKKYLSFLYPDRRFAFPSAWRMVSQWMPAIFCTPAIVRPWESSDLIYTAARLVILVPGHLYGLSSVIVS